MAKEFVHNDLLGNLREVFVQGEFLPGSKVPEALLCERFGISRTPLREALKVLAAEGHVELLPNRGARVRELRALPVNIICVRNFVFIIHSNGSARKRDGLLLRTGQRTYK